MENLQFLFYYLFWCLSCHSVRTLSICKHSFLFSVANERISEWENGYFVLIWSAIKRTKWLGRCITPYLTATNTHTHTHSIECSFWPCFCTALLKWDFFFQRIFIVLIALRTSFFYFFYSVLFAHFTSFIFPCLTVFLQFIYFHIKFFVCLLLPRSVFLYPDIAIMFVMRSQI